MTAQVAYEMDYQDRMGQHAPMYPASTITAQPTGTAPTAVAYPVDSQPKYNPQYRSTAY